MPFMIRKRMQSLLGYELFISKRSTQCRIHLAQAVLITANGSRSATVALICLAKENLPIIRTPQYNARLEYAFPVSRCKQLELNPKPAIRIR